MDVEFGACPICEVVYRFPLFSSHPVEPVCACRPPIDEASDAVERGREFDHEVHREHRELLASAGEQEVPELLMVLTADLGNVHAAYLNAEPKARRAFLLRMAALVRYLAVDRGES